MGVAPCDIKDVKKRKYFYFNLIKSFNNVKTLFQGLGVSKGQSESSTAKPGKDEYQPVNRYFTVESPDPRWEIIRKFNQV